MILRPWTHPAWLVSLRDGAWCTIVLVGNSSLHGSNPCM